MNEEFKQITNFWLSAPFLEKYRAIGERKLDELRKLRAANEKLAAEKNKSC